MSEVVYRSEAVIERVAGPLRRAKLPGESEPVAFGVHGAIAAHSAARRGRTAARDDHRLRRGGDRGLTRRDLRGRAGGAPDLGVRRPAPGGGRRGRWSSRGRCSSSGACTS